MMNIRLYLDSTYLKTHEQAGLSVNENLEIVKTFVNEAIQENFKLVMLRPDVVSYAKKIIASANSKVLVGTVIDFPTGTASLDEKLKEAQDATANGADELDFVADYEGFKAGEIARVKEQILECTRLGLDNKKIVKWIIEVAALDDHQIVQFSALIKNIVLTHFSEADYNNVFVKSSTGFYQTDNDKPSGATITSIKLMLENAFPLPVKAAGGVRTYQEAVRLIALGVMRIGTSSAKSIVSGDDAESSY